jgi:hypothetical protein
MVTDLRASSDWFAELWDTYTVAHQEDAGKLDLLRVTGLQTI